MEFRQLEAFVNAVKYKSFSRAADVMFLTQPTLSTHVGNLENELGVKLLNRTGREIVLTARGREFYSYALELLNTRERAILSRDPDLHDSRTALSSGADGGVSPDVSEGTVLRGAVGQPDRQ